MSETLQKIRAIKSEVVRLVKKQEKLNLQFKELNQKNIFLQEKIEEQSKQIEVLTEKNKNLEFANLLKQGEGNSDVKQRIDQMVREIDKCIELLNK